MEKIQKSLKQLPFRLKVSLIAAAKVFVLRPWYVLLALLGVILSASLVIWSLNLDLARFILFELNVSLSIKLQTVFWDPYWSVFSTFENFQALGIVIFSGLFGVNLAIFVYVLKHQGFKNIPKKSSFGGTVFAVLAGGCVACGTSILAPLVATFGATSSAFLRDLSIWLNWAASLLMLYSIYKLGLLAATANAKKQQPKADGP